MFDKLKAPFPPEAVSWRAQQVTKQGDKALALAYIDARDVMRRLDDVVGPACWQDSYHETTKGRLICTLSINVDGVWISKSDGAGDTDVEGEKGAISDAFKRAAVKWGIGRYLYETDTVFAPCEVREANGKRYWQKWKPEAHKMFAAALDKAAKATHVTARTPAVDEASTAPRPATITEEQLTELELLLDQLGVPVAAFLQVGNVSSLREVPATEFNNAKAWINNKAREMRAAKQEAA